MAARAQLNLLPDIKLSNVRNQRGRRLVSSIAILVSLVSVALFLIMLATVYGVQKKQLSDANKSISSLSSSIKGTSDLNKILTVQNQLSTLVGLHNSEHATSRVFTYIPEVTPSNVSLTNLTLDLANNAMEIDGTADSQKTVNTFIDTLKFTTYTLGSDTGTKNAFPSVVESSFGVGQNFASFSLNITYDPVLFSNDVTDSSGNKVTPKLNVPKLTSTRSVLDDPSLFGGQSGGGQ